MSSSRSNNSLNSYRPEGKEFERDYPEKIGRGYESRDRERDRESYRHRDRDYGRERGRDRDYRSRSRSRSRDRNYRDSYNRSRDRDRDRDYYRRKSRSRSRSPRRSPQRERRGPYSPERPSRDLRGPSAYYPPPTTNSQTLNASSSAPAIPSSSIPTYPPYVSAPYQQPPPSAPYHNNPPYSHPHPPAPPSMPWRDSAPSNIPSYAYPPASYERGRSDLRSRPEPPSTMGYAPYGHSAGRTDSFGSFSNLHRQNWSAMNLIPFEKNFYREHPVVSGRSEAQVEMYRQQHAMSVFGSNVPKPVQTFEEGSFPEYISKMLSSQGFDSPTAIQAQVRK